MKTTLTVTTVVEITGVKTSYEIWEALTKSFKNVAYVDRTQDNPGYSFTYKGNPTVDLKALESKVNKICEKVHVKEQADEIKQEAEARKKMKGFAGFVLTPVKNKYAKMMDEVIEWYDDRIKDSMADNEFFNAACSFSDAEDMVQLRKLLEAKDAGVYKFIRSLDTSVRETIPEKVYEYIDDLATGG